MKNDIHKTYMLILSFRHNWTLTQTHTQTILSIYLVTFWRSYCIFLLYDKLEIFLTYNLYQYSFTVSVKTSMEFRECIRVSNNTHKYCFIVNVSYKSIFKIREEFSFKQTRVMSRVQYNIIWWPTVTTTKNGNSVIIFFCNKHRSQAHQNGSQVVNLLPCFNLREYIEIIVPSSSLKGNKKVTKK